VQGILNRLYNFDFRGANQRIDAFVAKAPGDPMGPALRAATNLFYELDRLKILEAEFVTDDKKIADKKVGNPDPAIRKVFLDSVAEAQRLAGAQLEKNGGDVNALFAFCMTEGMRSDYMALVEKRQIGSLAPARQAQAYAVRILKQDPNFVDAYLTRGINEYLLGSIPFFLRWFLRFEDTEGSKALARQHLERVGREGRYLGPFARILLCIIAAREKQPEVAARLLEELTREFPENGLMRMELRKVRAKLGIAR
jgi:hypothetical protein